jgi:hypothetical protein
LFAFLESNGIDIEVVQRAVRGESDASDWFECCSKGVCVTVVFWFRFALRDNVIAVRQLRSSAVLRDWLASQQARLDEVCVRARARVCV